MSLGLQVLGSHGGLQIDQDYRNLLRVASGSCNGGDNTITIPDQSPLIPQIYVRPFADGQYVGATIVDSPTSIRIRTSRIIRDNGGGVTDNGGGVGFDWVAFGVNSPQILDASGMGLQVFDAAGNVAFDSRYEGARVQQAIVINDQAGLTDLTISYPRAYGFSGWGLRPWLQINPFSRLDQTAGTYGYFVTTSGTSGIVMRWAELDAIGGAIRWIDDHFGGTCYPFQGGYADVGALRRYSD